jgi:hypothetical protein
VKAQFYEWECVTCGHGILSEKPRLQKNRVHGARIRADLYAELTEEERESRMHDGPWQMVAFPQTWE